MSMGRVSRQGAVPEEVFVLSTGNSHRLYATLGTARATKTSETSHSWNQNDNYKIYKCKTTDWEEVDD